MLSGRRVRAAASAVAAFLFCCVCVACPADAGDDEDARILMFSGRDLWGKGAFLYGGFLIAPGGFEMDGFMLKLGYATGVYRYTSQYLGGERVIGSAIKVDVLPGFRIKRGPVEMKFFFGLDLEWHQLWPADPSNKLSGYAHGLRFAGEFWWDITPELVAFGDLSLSTVVSTNSFRLAVGKLYFQETLNGLYVGPEFQYFGAEGYGHTRLGLHLTSMKTETYEWSAAVGWARDNDKKGMAYARLGLAYKIVD